MSEAAAVLAELLKPGSWFRMPLAVVRALGPMDAVVFGYLLGLSERFTDDEADEDSAAWFYRTAKSIERDTGLSRDQQKRAIRRLREMGWIVVELDDVPFKTKRHFSINYEKLYEDLSKGAFLPPSDQRRARGQICPTTRGQKCPTRKGANLPRLVDEEEVDGTRVADAEDGVPPRAGKSRFVGGEKTNGHSPHKINGFHSPPKKSRFALPVKNKKLSAFDLKAGKKIKRMLTDAGTTLGVRTKAETFADSVRRLRERGGVPEAKIRGVVDWLAVHYGEPYVPRLHAGDDLFEKWDSFTAACHKETTGNLSGEDLEARVQQEAWSRYREAYPDDGFNYDYQKMDKFRREVRRELTGTAAE